MGITGGFTQKNISGQLRLKAGSQICVRTCEYDQGFILYGMYDGGAAWDNITANGPINVWRYYKAQRDYEWLQLATTPFDTTGGHSLKIEIIIYDSENPLQHDRDKMQAIVDMGLPLCITVNGGYIWGEAEHERIGPFQAYMPIHVRNLSKSEKILVYGMYTDGDSTKFENFTGELSPSSDITFIPDKDYEWLQVIRTPFETSSFDYAFCVYQEKDTGIINNIRAIGNSAGIYQKFSAHGFIWGESKKERLGPIKAGIPRYFHTFSSSKPLRVYGMLESSEYDTLIPNAYAGELHKVTPKKDYAWIQVVPMPYSPTESIDYTFGVVQSDMESQALYQSLENISNSVNSNSCKIFKKVVCCGDSYTSGHIQYDSSGAIPTNEEFAWPHFMSTLTGNEWLNCGRSGANVLTWQTDPRGLPRAKEIGKTQAYVVGLQLNDVSDSARNVPLGTSSDIGTDAKTYYGGMSQIVVALHEISPDAKIFINTCPESGTVYDQYNAALREIVAYYKDRSYNIYCIDLAAVSSLYLKDPVLSVDKVYGHYTAIGYNRFSELYAKVLSDFINANPREFKNVHQIAYNS